MFKSFLVTSLCFGSSSLVRAAPSGDGLPVVDLGYERHKALSYNETGDYYNFLNIRFAQSPVGELRFRKPLAPKGKSSAIDDGSVSRICPQGTPKWSLVSAEFERAYLSGQPFDEEAAWAAVNASWPLPTDPRSTEDCLFLDVVVPKKIYERASVKSKPKLAPVLVWIYGGGWVGGSKDLYGNPAGLIKRSQVNGDDGIIYVAINYRLGAFGFLNSVEVDKDGVVNAGLYDQRLALEWVQKNIHLFGGDKSRVTISGESAGGASVLYQATAFGSRSPAPFKRAIDQSGPLPFFARMEEQRPSFEGFLRQLNVSTIAEARRLPTATLQKANSDYIAEGGSSTLAFGPVVDKKFVPDFPIKLLRSGAYASGVEMMVSHTSHEGLLVVDPAFQDPKPNDFKNFLARVLPELDASELEFIDKELYPAVYDGSQPYTEPVGRVTQLASEASFFSVTNQISHSFGPKSYAYEFDIDGGSHGSDVGYTFYNGNAADVRGTPVTKPELARPLQEYLTSFVKTGKPVAASAPKFPSYGKDGKIALFNEEGLSIAKDGTNNARVKWWQDFFAKQTYT